MSKLLANDMCRIPVSVTKRIVNGKCITIDAEYMDIPADAIAQFLIQKFGVDVIFGEGSDMLCKK